MLQSKRLEILANLRSTTASNAIISSHTFEWFCSLGEVETRRAITVQFSSLGQLAIFSSRTKSTTKKKVLPRKKKVLILIYQLLLRFLGTSSCPSCAHVMCDLLYYLIIALVSVHECQFVSFISMDLYSLYRCTRLHR